MGNNIEKIAINGFFVYVDKEAKIKEGDYCFIDKTEFSKELKSEIFKVDEILQERSHNLLNYSSGWRFSVSYSYTIIAASPELNLEGVPSWEAYLAEQEYPTFNLPLSVTTGIHSIMQEGFIKGYQTAEKELFTEDDVRKAFEAGMQFIGEDKSSWKEFIEQLKQDKK